MLKRDYFKTQEAWQEYVDRLINRNLGARYGDRSSGWGERIIIPQPSTKSSPMVRTPYNITGHAHGMPSGFDPLDVRTQLKLSEQALSRNLEHGGQMAWFHRMEIERYKQLLEAGQHRLPIEWGEEGGVRESGIFNFKSSYLRRASSYNIKGMGTGALGIPSDMDEAAQGFTPGWGKPDMGMARQDIRASIEAIENSDIDDVQKTIKINKILQSSHANYFQQEAEEASGAFRLESAGGGALEKWWGKYDKTRVPFYQDISLRSYKPAIGDQGFLGRIGIDLERMTDTATGAPISYRDIPARIAAAEKSMYINGEKVIGTTRMPLTSGDLFLGEPSHSGSRLFMSPTAQRALAIEQYGQSKVLLDEAGEVIPLGTKVIGTTAMNASAISKEEYLESIRKLYFEALNKGSVANVEKYRMLISDATLDLRAFNPLISGKEIKVHKKIKEIRNFVKQDKDIGNAINLTRGTKRVTYKGYEAVRDIVERSPAGAEFMLGAKNSKKLARVADLTSINDVSLLLTGSRVKTFGQHLKETMNLNQRLASRPDLFEAYLVREPFVKGSEVHPYTLKVMAGKGTYLGNVSAEIEKTFGTAPGSEVARGYVGKAYVRPYMTYEKKPWEKGATKGHKVYKLGIWKTPEEAYEKAAPIGIGRLSTANTVTGHWNVQEEISNMMNMVGDEWTAPELEKLIASKHPSVSLRSLGATESAAWREGLGIPKVKAAGGRGHGRAMMVGAAVTAGALMLWGASRIRNTAPITPKDVPDNLYGRSAPVPPDSGRMYTPAARISPDNNGYMTNIDIETGDDSGIVDHRGMAASMSTISRNALGVRTANTSLHVTDDSEGFNRESTRRKLNQQLSV